MYLFLIIKTPSGLRQPLTTQSLLKVMKNAFYFTLKSFCSQDIQIFVLTFR